MQQGGARPGQAHNEERADNALLRYAGKALPVILQVEAVDEQPQGIMTDRQASQNIESGFVFTALQRLRLPKESCRSHAAPCAGKPPPATGPR